MHEDQSRLGFEGTDETRPAQFPAVDVKGALAKHKEHGTASYGVSVRAPRASRGAGTATAVARPDRNPAGNPGSRGPPVRAPGDPHTSQSAWGSEHHVIIIQLSRNHHASRPRAA